MQDTRRAFLKKMAMLSGTAGLSGVLPSSIKRAAAINPVPGSTYMDAEHVVILMQENRSFDHTFGTLKGVRGYNDPRAIRLPDNNLVWLQSNEKGETFIPFRFDIKNTKATWMGSVPHSRPSQVDAWNNGRYDNWLPAKRVRDKKYAEMPLTMGYYTREDIPFYYALADAFTVCDQNFCSGMTPTRPNRLFFWTGTVRAEQNGKSKAHVRNSDEHYGSIPPKWETFPERLEENGISWKFYQNDIACGGGMSGDQRAWLGNFGCNPLEWFANYNVKFSDRYIQSLRRQQQKLPEEISQLESKAKDSAIDAKALQKIKRAVAKKKEVLENAEKELAAYSRENFEKLSEHQKQLYNRAFVTNAGNADYHELTTLEYDDNGTKRSLLIPKSDPLYQFRKDVESGHLSTVSWLAGAQNFSDHPSAPWYGSLYLSEILDILTKNPEVWKKTIFIVTFDENDGYFDHVPPFAAPDPRNPKTGRCSSGITTDVEYIYKEDELADGESRQGARSGPVGLGFRVPLIVASPWSRGGQVGSQVFDHTSTLQFLEGFLSRKFNKHIQADNISAWRRAICGDLTSLFTPYNGEHTPQLPFLEKEPFIEQIYNARFKKVPYDFKALTKAEIEAVNKAPLTSGILPRQEPGIKPSCPTFYQLYAEGGITKDQKNYEITFTADDAAFGNKTLGAAFNVYCGAENACYTVKAGDSLSERWPLKNAYQFDIYGPNGFYRAFKGDKNDPALKLSCFYEKQKGLNKKLTGNIVINLINLDPDKTFVIELVDNAYDNKPITKELVAGDHIERNIILDLTKSHGWYDFTVRVKGFAYFEKRYAGHVETGEASYTDPVMGRVS